MKQKSCCQGQQLFCFSIGAEHCQKQQHDGDDDEQMLSAVRATEQRTVLAAVAADTSDAAAGAAASAAARAVARIHVDAAHRAVFIAAAVAASL